MSTQNILIVMATVTLLVVPATAIPAIVAQGHVPVAMVIDRFVEITPVVPGIELFEKPDGWWQGCAVVIIANNWSVTVTARIEAYYPSIVSDPVNKPFDCVLEGDTSGFDGNGTSVIVLDPDLAGRAVRLRAGIQDPDLMVRPSSARHQRVATVYLTVQE